MKRNLAVVRARLNGAGWFRYDSPVGNPFICFADDAVSLRVFASSYLEVAEIQIAKLWLQPSDLCIDVGANVGVMSAAFASAVGNTGRVLALEPSPATFARLSDAIRHLRLENVTPIACCASDHEGVTEFYVSTTADPEEESIRVSEARLEQFRRTVVTCARLDHLHGRMGEFRAPALIKVDVEGAEPLVLKGAEQFVGGIAPPLVIVELQRRTLLNHGFEPADVLRHFPEDRFDRFIIPRSVSDQIPGRLHGHIYRLENEQNLPLYSNLIAVPCVGEFANRSDFIRTSLPSVTSTVMAP